MVPAQKDITGLVLRSSTKDYGSMSHTTSHPSISVPVMARPKSINPKGDTHRLMVTLAMPVVEKLSKEATKQGVSVSEIVRQKLAS